MSRKVEIKEFAERVERLCDFFLDKIPMKDNSEDQKILHNLKEDAADIQFNEGSLAEEVIFGLDGYMRGMQRSSNEVRSSDDRQTDRSK